MRNQQLSPLIACLFFLQLGTVNAQNNVGIGTAFPSTNAILHLENGASDLGLLLPNVDISGFTPAGSDAGLMVYNTPDNKIYIWTGGGWVSSTSEWGVNGLDIFNLNSGNVGIGANNPTEKLTVVDNVFGAIMSLNSSAGNTLMNLNNSGSNPANWRFGYLGNTGVDPGFMTFLRGSHRFVVTNNGDVGIAETNPQARLEINSSGNSTLSYGLLINNSNPANIFAVRDDGNVGIGTVTPSSRLHVQGPGNFDIANTEGDFKVGNATHRFKIGVAYSGGGAGDVYLGAQGGTSRLFLGGGATLADFQTLTVASGNVGIGVTSPAGALEINNAEWNSNPVILNTTGSVGPSIRFRNTAIGNRTYDIIGSTGPGASTGVGFFGIYDNTGLAYRFVINPTGLIGIGTNVPTANLHVNGTGIYTGRLALSATTDASGVVGTGVLEIANALRIDGNEIITNTNTALYLQNDNNGDLFVDGSTFVVDASENRVGIGTTTPSTRGHYTSQEPM